MLFRGRVLDKSRDERLDGVTMTTREEMTMTTRDERIAAVTVPPWMRHVFRDAGVPEENIDAVARRMAAHDVSLYCHRGSLRFYILRHYRALRRDRRA